MVANRKFKAQYRINNNTLQVQYTIMVLKSPCLFLVQRLFQMKGMKAINFSLKDRDCWPNLLFILSVLNPSGHLNHKQKGNCKILWLFAVRSADSLRLNCVYWSTYSSALSRTEVCLLDVKRKSAMSFREKF